MRNNIRYLGWSIILSGAILVGLTGCENHQVNENQGDQAFTEDVQAKLSGFETRLAKVKSEMTGREEAVHTRVEVLTEQAEEKIETLRDSSLPTLTKAGGDEERQRVKNTINTTLSEIGDEVARAESAIQDATTAREKYFEETSVDLDKLRDRYDDLKTKAQGYTGAAKAELDMALESAEEAIQEARSNLPKYQAAAEDQADQMRKTIASLLDDAGRELDKAADAMKQ